MSVVITRCLPAASVSDDRTWCVQVSPGFPDNKHLPHLFFKNRLSQKHKAVIYWYVLRFKPQRLLEVIFKVIHDANVWENVSQQPAVPSLCLTETLAQPQHSLFRGRKMPFVPFPVVKQAKTIPQLYFWKILSWGVSLFTRLLVLTLTFDLSWSNLFFDYTLTLHTCGGSYNPISWVLAEIRLFERSPQCFLEFFFPIF